MLKDYIHISNPLEPQFLSWFFLALAALNLDANIPKPSHSFIIVIDISLSMNTKDIQINADKISRISFVRESLENTLRELPCGTRIGVGIFAGYQQHAGGGWTGDVEVIDWEQREDAEHVSEIHRRRFRSGENFVTK